MIYLIYGTKHFLIKKQISEIKQNFTIDSITTYDLNITDTNELIDDANTPSFFSDKKLIIGENATMFTGSGKTDNLLEEYLKNPNPNTTIIFTIDSEKIDKRKKITKLIDKNGKIIEYTENTNITSFIKKEFENYNIQNKEINLLKDRVGDNLEILQNEIDKIKIFKDKDTLITEEDIINLTTKNVDTNIFSLIDHIVLNHKNEALEIYYEMRKTLNEEPIKIIVILANQFRIMYQSKELLKRGLSEKDIAETLNIHPYRVKLALQNSRKYDSKMILNYINDLAQIDIDIKTGKIDKDLALELFILKK